jgi:hypothetical protein
MCVNNEFCESYVAAVIAHCIISNPDSNENRNLNELIPNSVLRKCVLLVLRSEKSTGYVHSGRGSLPMSPMFRFLILMFPGNVITKYMK